MNALERYVAKKGLAVKLAQVIKNSANNPSMINIKGVPKTKRPSGYVAGQAFNPGGNKSTPSRGSTAVGVPSIPAQSKPAAASSSQMTDKQVRGIQASDAYKNLSSGPSAQSKAPAAMKVPKVPSSTMSSSKSLLGGAATPKSVAPVAAAGAASPTPSPRSLWGGVAAGANERNKAATPKPGPRRIGMDGKSTTIVGNPRSPTALAGAASSKPAPQKPALEKRPVTPIRREGPVDLAQEATMGAARAKRARGSAPRVGSRRGSYLKAKAQFIAANKGKSSQQLLPGLKKLRSDYLSPQPSRDSATPLTSRNLAGGRYGHKPGSAKSKPGTRPPVSPAYARMLKLDGGMPGRKPGPEVAAKKPGFVERAGTALGDRRREYILKGNKLDHMHKSIADRRRSRGGPPLLANR